MFEILGFRKNEGTLKNGNNWSNFTLFCSKKDSSVTGKSVQEIKVPTSLLQSVFPSSDDILNCKVNFIFDVKTYNGNSKVVVTDIIIAD